jgi:hypothetical protein
MRDKLISDINSFAAENKWEDILQDIISELL